MLPSNIPWNGIHEELHEQGNKTQSNSWEYKIQRIILVFNVCLCRITMNATTTTTTLFVPYIDLHETKKLERNMERVQATHNSH